MRVSSRVYAVFGWLIVSIGTLHMFATFRLSAGIPLGKVWFFGSGLAIALVGALNLLHCLRGFLPGGKHSLSDCKRFAHAHRDRRWDNIGRQSAATSNYLVAVGRRFHSIVHVAAPR